MCIRDRISVVRSLGTEAVADANWRIERDLAPRKPTIVVMLWGHGDLRKGEEAATPEVYRDQLTAWIKQAQGLGAWVVVSTPAIAAAEADDARLESYAEAARAVASATGATLCDLRAAAKQAKAAGNELLKGDGLSADGHRLAANQLARCIGEVIATAPMEIDIRDRAFTDRLDVRLQATRTKGPQAVTFKYLMDSDSDLAQRGRSYDKPIPIRKDSELRVLAENPATGETAEASARYRKQKPERAGRLPSRAALGLRYRFFDAGSKGLKELADWQSEVTGTFYNFDLALRQTNPSIPPKNEEFSIEFSGMIHIPVTGVYTFATISDDGTRLWVAEREVVDNSGHHGMVRREGEVALEAGHHPIRLAYSQGAGGFGLRVEYEGPGIRWTTIPDSSLWHEADRDELPHY